MPSVGESLLHLLLVVELVLEREGGFEVQIAPSRSSALSMGWMFAFRVASEVALNASAFTVPAQ
jgi:hypothetical protein